MFIISVEIKVVEIGNHIGIPIPTYFELSHETTESLAIVKSLAISAARNVTTE